ncbi:MAG: PAS domain S-box protein [Myxacorys chilensis ATA2-1-KO14]|nr:PAS domain S-box protein [Myxacorys chilensis ATA2-1-KO14]
MESLFAGEGEMRAMLRERFGWGNADGSQPLTGAISEWPQSLRTAVSLCLGSPQPIALWWGRDYLWFYNDAYCLLEQTNHPQCLGRPGRECWAEDGNRMASLLDSVRETGVSTCLEDVQRIVTRNGYAEETYFTFTYSPIQDESGGIGGVFCTCTETTKRVLSDRRLKTLRELSVNTGQAETVQSACTLTVETLAQNSYDLPFALLYVVEAGGRRAYLAGTAGMEAGTIASPQQVDLATATDVWHLTEVKTTGQAHQINGLTAQLKALPEGGWEDAPDAAIVLPLRPSGPRQPVVGLLVLGISPRREFDDDYRGFFDLIASNVATVIANANAYETKITEPKPAEIALQRSEERYRAFIAQSSEAIWCFELEEPVPICCSEDEQIQRFYQHGYLSECNQMMAQMYGVSSPQGLVGAKLGAFLVQSDAHNTDYLKAFIGSGYRLIDAESYEVDQSGNPKVFLNNLVGVIEDGMLVRAWGTHRDITERKQAEQRLQLYASVVRDVQVGIVVWQLEDVCNLGSFRLLISNPAASAATGVDFESLIGTRMAEHFPALVQSPLVQQYADVVQTGRSLDLGEVQYSEDGITAGTYSLKAFSLPNQCLGLVFENITVRKAIEAQLEESQRYRQQIAETMPGILFVHDLIEQRITYTNRQITDLLGYTPEQVQAMGTAVVPTIVHPNDLERVYAYFEEFSTAPEDAVLSIEYQAHHANGAWRWFYSQSVVFNRTADGIPHQVLGVTIDVSDRKRADQALRDAHVQIESALVAGEIYTWRFNILENCVTVNAAFARLFAVDPNEAAMGLPLEQFINAIHEDDRPRILAAIYRAIETGGEFVTEYRVQTVTGEVRWVAARGRVEYDSQGRPVAFPGALADISDRKQVEESLRQSEARAQLAIGVGRLGMWRYDLGTNLVELDERMREIWGEPPDVVLLPLSAVMDRIHPDDQARVAEAINAAIDPGSLGTYDIEYRIVWADQTERWVLANGLTQFEGEGLSRRVMSFIGTAIDITHHKQVEEALRQREAELRLITNTLPVLISFIDSEQRYRFNNHTYEEWFGHSANEIYGKHVREVLGEEAYDVIRPHIEQVLSGQQASFEAEVPYASVGTRYVHVNYVPRFGAQGTVEGFVVLVSDISETKRAEAEREQLLAREQAAREQAVAANRIKDEFLAVLSHELRTPMNPILGWSKLLRAGKLDSIKTAHALETIERNAKLQTQLIEDLLDVSRILQGKLNLKMAPVNLEATLEASLETLRLAIEAKSIQVHTLLKPIAGQVLGDSARLQQVIWNLLSNAVKFTPEGGRVEIRLNYTASHAQLQVNDTGRGIVASFLPHVFEYFRQADGTTTRTFGGLGLGLAIVRHLVELHGGTVGAESAGEGQGATFTVKLPLLKQEETMQNEVQFSSTSSPHPLSHLRILLVDDDTDTRELSAFILRQAGATVTSVGSAIAALAALPQTQPHVLVSDIGMPEIDGYGLIRQVRAMPQGEQILAIALTAYAGEINAQHAIAAGFQRHLSKPVEPEMLIAAIAALATQLNRETD